MSTRLKTIEVCDFRAFPVTQKFDLGGKHLLLYGENGSGKSSLFQAIAKLLDLSKKAEAFDDKLERTRCLKNRFTNPSDASGHITITFAPGKTGATAAEMIWQINRERPKAHPLFVSMARSRGCLDYRSILKTNFLHEESDNINLFGLIVETLLRDIEQPNSTVTFAEEYGSIENKDSIQTKGSEYLEFLEKDPEAMDDFERQTFGLEMPPADVSASGEFAYGEGHYSDVEPEEIEWSELWNRYLEQAKDALDAQITDFNRALSDKIEEIQRLANRFVKHFDKSLEINLNYDAGLKVPTLETKDDWLKSPQLLLQAKYDRLELAHPALFLNEARLTAIALAIYFGALKTETPDKTKEFPRLLVLDDVLVGLDMSNRLPVLDLIKAEFADDKWQVLLMTFDRAWYELAKWRLDRNKEWECAELYVGSVGSDEHVGKYEKPILINDNDHLERAIDFLVKGEVKAAAVHVRTEYELVLKKACEDFKVSIPYQNFEKPEAETLWNALLTLTFEFERPPKVIVKNGKPELINQKRPKIECRYIPHELESRIRQSVRWILNPLSHSQTIDRYPREIEQAIYAVAELRDYTRKMAKGDIKKLYEQRQKLLTVLIKRKT